MHERTTRECPGRTLGAENSFPTRREDKGKKFFKHRDERRLTRPELRPTAAPAFVAAIALCESHLFLRYLRRTRNVRASARGCARRESAADSRRARIISKREDTRGQPDLFHLVPPRRFLFTRHLARTSIRCPAPLCPPVLLSNFLHVISRERPV